MEWYIAYQGTKFTIEWYYNTRGESTALEYFKSLPPSYKEKALYLFKMMGDHGKIKNKEKFRHEGDQIFEFKPSPHRFLCFFFKDGKIVITNGFEKKTPKLPPREKEKAIKFMDDYIERIKEGIYYE